MKVKTEELKVSDRRHMPRSLQRKLVDHLVIIICTWSVYQHIHKTSSKTMTLKSFGTIWSPLTFSFSATFIVKGLLLHFF
jgi:hypothetical protein